MTLKPKSRRRGFDRVAINLTSMIDVTFLLLFFFMVSMAITDQESRLSTALQTRGEGGGASDLVPQRIEVRPVDGKPAYRIGERLMHSREELSAVLQGLPRETGVFVQVAAGVDVGFAVTAVQTARDLGFEQVTYVADES